MEITFRDGVIEQIGTGDFTYKMKKLLRIKMSSDKIYDTLYLSNKLSYWLLDLFDGYKQLGIFRIARPHNFRERQKVRIYFMGGHIIEVLPLDEAKNLEGTA